MLSNAQSVLGLLFVNVYFKTHAHLVNTPHIP